MGAYSRKYKFNVINQSVLPYNLINDVVNLKITLLKNNKLSYKAGVSGDIYTNITGAKIADFTTNEYGVAFVSIPTQIMPNNIDTALFWVNAEYNNKSIYSVKVRANFIFTDAYEYIIINAGTCGEFITDRDSYTIYDAGCLTHTGTRTINRIINRGV